MSAETDTHAAAHADGHADRGLQKLVYMANQIARFMASKPQDQGVAGVVAHINDFWEPRMRRHLFQVLDAGGAGLDPLVIEAAGLIRRPSEA